jgi:hypothetical protein
MTSQKCRTFGKFLSYLTKVFIFAGLRGWFSGRAKIGVGFLELGAVAQYQNNN